MQGDAGGWLWFFIDVVLVLILAGAIIYGLTMWRRQRDRQSPHEQARREQATRDVYQAEERRLDHIESKR